METGQAFNWLLIITPWNCKLAHRILVQLIYVMIWRIFRILFSNSCFPLKAVMIKGKLQWLCTTKCVVGEHRQKEGGNLWNSTICPITFIISDLLFSPAALYPLPSDCRFSLIIFNELLKKKIPAEKQSANTCISFLKKNKRTYIIALLMDSSYSCWGGSKNMKTILKKRLAAAIQMNCALTWPLLRRNLACTQIRETYGWHWQSPHANFPCALKTPFSDFCLLFYFCIIYFGEHLALNIIILIIYTKK